jgi:DNA-binding transcriptional regulator YiaG
LGGGDQFSRSVGITGGEHQPQKTMNKIRALRRRLGLNLTDFANLLGTTQLMISDWERGRYNVPKIYRNLIRRRTGYDPDTLQKAAEGDGEI